MEAYWEAVWLTEKECGSQVRWLPQGKPGRREELCEKGCPPWEDASRAGRVEPRLPFGGPATGGICAEGLGAPQPHRAAVFVFMMPFGRTGPPTSTEKP